MTQQEAIKIAEEFYNGDEIYVLLSVRAANLIEGNSVPFIGQREDHIRMLQFFTSFEKAKYYIDMSGYEKPAGNYFVSKINKEDKSNNLDVVLNSAFAMGVASMNVDTLAANAFGCNIDWFLKVNHIPTGEVATIHSEEDLEKVKTGNNGQAQIYFNKMPIYEYKNPYSVTQQRAEGIFKQLFQGGYSVAEFKTMLRVGQSLDENVYVADCLNSKLIPQARKNQKTADIEFFNKVNFLIETVAWERLDEEKELYILVDPDTKELFINREAMYVIYTNFYHNSNKLEYKKVSGKKELLEIAVEKEIQQMIVSDGQTKMVVVERPIFEKKDQ